MSFENNNKKTQHDAVSTEKKEPPPSVCSLVRSMSKQLFDQLQKPTTRQEQEEQLQLLEKIDMIMTE